MAKGYFGCDSVQTSTTNEEIIQRHKPTGYTIPIRVYKMTFMNTQACKIKINDSSPIYLPAGEGFECSKDDAPIETFVIVDASINYYYICAY